MRQGHVDLAELALRIRREFPDLRFAEARLNDLGEDHAVVVLDDRRVFRFPRTPGAAERGSAERRLLTRLNEVSNVLTPRYEHVARAGDFGGYRMIAGQELTEAAFAALPRAAQGRILSEIGVFLRVLHALPADLVRATAHSAEDAAGFGARYARRRDRLARRLGAALIAGADRFCEALPSAVTTSRTVVCHHDFTEDHILIDPKEGRLAGVIDFTDAALGDPARDFTFLWAYGQGALEQVARSYGAAEDAGMLLRSLWWFARYRIDQVWWAISGVRDYDVAAIKTELEDVFATLGV